MGTYEESPDFEFTQANKNRFKDIATGADAFLDNRLADLGIVRFSSIDQNTILPESFFSYNADHILQLSGSISVYGLYLKARNKLLYDPYWATDQEVATRPKESSIRCTEAYYRHRTTAVNDDKKIEVSKAELLGLGVPVQRYDITVIDELLTKQLRLTSINGIIESYLDTRPTTNPFLDSIRESLNTEEGFLINRMANGFISEEDSYKIHTQMLLKYKDAPNKDIIYKILSEANRQAISARELRRFSSDFSIPTIDFLDEIRSYLHTT